MRPANRLRRILMHLLLTGAVTTLAAAEDPSVPIPDTPAGRRFAEIMRLTDTGDPQAIAAYVSDRFTEEMRAANPDDPGITAFLVDHAKRFGGFEVRRELSSTDEQVTMLVRPRSQPTRYLRYVVNVESAPAHRVQGLFLMPAAPEDIPKEGSPLTPEAALVAFTREVDRVLGSGAFSGVVLLARGDEVVLERTAGEADREHHVPVTAETLFGLASMNKMFTAVAIGRLVDQGRLAWKDPVEKHLPGWLPEAARGTTVDALLTHRSGLGDYLDSIRTDPKIRETRVLSDYRDLIRTSPVEPAPEGGLRYSNTGYLVLGALIEAVTGRDYFEFVRQEVFAPAGMTRTDSWCRDEIVEGRAIGYVPPGEAAAAGLGNGWRSNSALQGIRGTSAGGGYSTARDLLRFARALVTGKLVRPETLETMLSPQARFLPGSEYGYGFVLGGTREGGRVFGHSGGFPGVSGELKVYGDGSWTLVVLSNVSGGAGELVGAWDGIAARLAP